MNLTGQCYLPAGVSGEGSCGPPLRNRNFLTYILLKTRSSAKAAFIALLFATDKRTAAAEGQEYRPQAPIPRAKLSKS